MLSELLDVAERLSDLGRRFDPARVDGDSASALLEAATRAERAAGAIRARAAARAAKARAWEREGCGSAEEWLAGKTGATKGDAHKVLELGERLERHEATREALTAGWLSEAQAGIVAGAADENPDAEVALLETAASEPVTALRREAAKAKAAVSDEEARQAKIHKQRFAGGGTDEDGAFRFSARMTADQGAIVDTIWRRFREHVARDARKRRERMTAGQVGADALVLMAQTAIENLDGPGGGMALPDVRLHLLVDHGAWERGHVEAGETCEIDGIGPTSVARARQLTAQGAFVTASTTDGRDVFRVAHLGTCDPASLAAHKVHERLAADGDGIRAIELEGRHVPAVLDTALTIRDRVCAHPGCDRRWGLQRDHIVAVELDGPTSYTNLQRLCWDHHQQKTRHDMAKITARNRHRDAGESHPARAGPSP